MPPTPTAGSLKNRALPLASRGRETTWRTLLYRLPNFAPALAGPGPPVWRAALATKKTTACCERSRCGQRPPKSFGFFSASTLQTPCLPTVGCSPCRQTKPGGGQRNWNRRPNRPFPLKVMSSMKCVLALSNQFARILAQRHERLIKLVYCTGKLAP